MFSVQIFPALYDWVAYPITLLIQLLYENEMKSIRKDIIPCPFRLELIASLERTLCFCHTGNAAALATSLMNPLGLSRAVVKDGFPMLHKVFIQHSVSSAASHGFQIDPRAWPLKDGHPAIASRRTQTLTYSLSHFMVSLSRTLTQTHSHLPPSPPSAFFSCLASFPNYFALPCLL